jgi:hypothetical protein
VKRADDAAVGGPNPERKERKRRGERAVRVHYVRIDRSKNVPDPAGEVVADGHVDPSAVERKEDVLADADDIRLRG